MASWPPVGRADGPGRAGIAGAGHERVVRALACCRADRVHRRQVDDVEAHVGDRVQPPRGGAQRPGLGLAPVRRVEHRSFGAREELIPGAVQRALPVHDQRVAAPSVVSRSRSGNARLRRAHLLASARLRAGPAAAARRPVARRPRQSGSSWRSWPACLRGRQRPGRRGSAPPPRSSSSAPSASISSTSWPIGTLISASWRQRADRIAPGLDREVPQALAVGRDFGAVAVQCPRPARASH